MYRTTSADAVVLAQALQPATAAPATMSATPGMTSVAAVGVAAQAPPPAAAASAAAVGVAAQAPTPAAAAPVTGEQLYTIYL
jgi:hypothetical protein